MSKSHVVQLTITNNTEVPLCLKNDHFNSGRVADGHDWPRTIAPHSTASVKCYEKDWSIGVLVGCSGWVCYTLNGHPLYFAFSNPSAGPNGTEFGASAGVWDNMHGHYPGVSRAVHLEGNTWATAFMRGTDGDINRAFWNVRVCEVETIQPANLELQDVVRVHASFPTTGTRRYYKTGTAPTSVAGIIKSHFKGISAYADKLIFTHTNLATDATHGKYLIADNVVGATQGETAATFDTQPGGLRHPCSSQACGSFMAMGIQADESGPGAATSEIQMFDIRPTKVNQPARLLGSIARPHEGVNGVAMTKEAGPEGKYLVAAVNGHNLSLYRSRSASLLTDGVAFEEIFRTTAFADSGAGLALVTQQGDGAIFLFALNADEGQPNYLNLYRLHVDSQPVTYELVAKKQMEIPGLSESVTNLTRILKVFPGLGDLAKMGDAMLNSSFRWGKGLAITSATTLEVYASDRNSIPYSDAALSDKDFSLVVWSNSHPATTPLYLTKEGSEGIWVFDAPTGVPTQVPTTAGYGFGALAAFGNKCYVTAQGTDGVWSFDPASGTVQQLENTTGYRFRDITAGKLLYMTVDTKGLSGIWSLDPTTNSLLQLAGTKGLGFRGIVAVGNMLYLTTTGSDGIWSYDLDKQVVSNFQSTRGLGLNGIVAVGNMLYATTQGSDGVWAFDRATAVVGQLPSTAGCGFGSIVSVGNTLYLTTQGKDGIWELNLDQMTLRTLPTTEKTHFRGLTKANTPLYLTKEGSEGIWMFDAPTGVPAQVPTTAGYGFNALAALGNKFYATAQGPNGVWSFDPASGTVSQLESAKDYQFSGITAGKLLYLTIKMDGPQGPLDGIWSLDPATGLLQQLPGTKGYGFRGIVAVGDMLYLTTAGGDGIFWYDVDKQALGRFPSTKDLGFNGIVAVGNILYLTTQGEDGVYTFNLATAVVRQLPFTAKHGFVSIIAVNNILYLTTQGKDGIWELNLDQMTLRPLPTTEKMLFRGLIQAGKLTNR